MLFLGEESQQQTQAGFPVADDAEEIRAEAAPASRTRCRGVEPHRAFQPAQARDMRSLSSAVYPRIRPDRQPLEKKAA